MSIDYDLNSPLQPYLRDMVANLPNGPKLVLQALSKKEWNKEDLSLKSGVRRGELNYAVCWLEALGFVEYNASGRQKLYNITPLGRKVYEEFHEIFHTLKEENRD